MSVLYIKGPAACYGDFPLQRIGLLSNCFAEPLHCLCPIETGRKKGMHHVRRIQSHFLSLSKLLINPWPSITQNTVFLSTKHLTSQATDGFLTWVSLWQLQHTVLFNEEPPKIHWPLSFDAQILLRPTPGQMCLSWPCNYKALFTDQKGCVSVHALNVHVIWNSWSALSEVRPWPYRPLRRRRPWFNRRWS